MKKSICQFNGIKLKSNILLLLLFISNFLGNFSASYAQPVSVCSGLKDNYNCPEESVSPNPALLNFLTNQYASNPCFGLLEFDNFPGRKKCNGVILPENALFIHELTFPITGILTSAILQFRAKAAPPAFSNSGQTNTDFIAFFEGSTYLTGANLNQLIESGGAWNPDQDAIFTLNLGNLPAVFSQSNILQYLNDGDLDVVIGNETGVDWMCIQPTMNSICCTDSLKFNRSVAQGFNVVVDHDQCTATITAPQFDSCYKFTSAPHVKGKIAPQVITDPKGMWKFNFKQSGNYTICVNVYEENMNGICWQKEMCTSFEITCNKPAIFTRYELIDKRCKYKLVPPTIIWKLGKRLFDSGGRDSVLTSRYHIQTAILKPLVWPAPNVLLTDTVGNLVKTEAGEEILLAENNSVASKIQTISPAPPGYSWYGLQSNLLTPNSSLNPDSSYFNISFEWLDLPPGSQDSTGAYWMSDDKDDLYGELITDAFTKLDSSKLVSLEDVSNLKSFRLYPNPTSNNLTLEFLSEVPKNGKVQIMDFSGKLFLTKTLQADKPKHQLSVVELPPGLYFVFVTDNRMLICITKFIKL